MTGKKLAIAGLIAGLAAGWVRLSAGEQPLTLEDCLKVVSENNRSLKIAREKVKAAQARESEAFSGYLPSLSATGVYTYNHIINQVALFGQEINLNIHNNWSGRLSLSQPIYMGGKIDGNYRQADLGVELARLDYEKLREDILFQARVSFYDMLLARQMESISQEAYAVTAEHLQVSQALYDAGKLSAYDLSRVKVQLANQKTSLLKAKNNAQLAADSLLNILGWEPALDTEFIGQLGYAEKPYKNYEAGLASAMEYRLEMRELICQERISDSAISLAHSGYLPTLILGSSVSRQNNLPISPAEAWNNSWSTNLTLNISLFEGGATRSRVRQAQTQKEQARLSREQLARTITIEVKQAYYAFAQAQENISGQGQNVDTAKDNLRIAQERYRLGLMSDLEVRDAELSLTQAEINFYQATYDYLVAQARLFKSIGETPEP